MVPLQRCRQFRYATRPETLAQRLLSSVSKRYRQHLAHAPTMVSKNIGGTLVAGPTGGGVVLYTGRKVLLQKRDHQPERYPGYWALFGGQIESDESPEEAAVREVKEELGLDLDIGSLRPLGTIEVLREGYNATLLFFTAPVLVDLGELKLGEGDGFALFQQEELHATQLIPAVRLALDRHFQMLGFGWQASD